MRLTPPITMVDHGWNEAPPCIRLSVYELVTDRLTALKSVTGGQKQGEEVEVWI